MPRWNSPQTTQAEKGWTLAKFAWVATGTGAALLEIAFARWRLRGLVGRDLVEANGQAVTRGRNCREARSGDAEAVARVAWLVPRVAKRVPWRADCLVQALAGQQMLLRRGIASEIVIGADGRPDAGFIPHAWLRYGERTVTGGEIGHFEVLLDPDRHKD
ncbi:lasso peptide biosynthesis B2 protein [Alteraurantiacibacter aquimixticola]|uniref:Lasso peptide biosynthesis B2 protein n=1 Tax=Alteraurantiacibacter aquimixticola TaxID=2489173 RepID=A0A4T3EZI2_9SPHN|nr:lasso peptide biosynthesis B2 protein [Alteraurantiacibacter aquimixticola]TIX48964.1 lasso peptide biosynthesis B2 protein [Alteraurantiacibacter aquimixticola]